MISLLDILCPTSLIISHSKQKMKCSKIATKEIEDDAVLDELENGRDLTEERFFQFVSTPGLLNTKEGQNSLTNVKEFFENVACDEFGKFKNPILSAEKGQRRGTMFYAIYRIEGDERCHVDLCEFDTVTRDKDEDGNIVLCLTFRSLTKGQQKSECTSACMYALYKPPRACIAPPPQKRKARSKSPVQSKKQKTSTTQTQTSLKTATTATTSSLLTVPIQAMTASELLQLMSPSQEDIDFNKDKLLQKMVDRFDRNKKFIEDKQSDLKVLEKYGHRDLTAEEQVEEHLQDNQTMQSIVNEYQASKKDFDAYSVLHDSCVELKGFKIDALEVEFKDHLDTVRQTLKTCFPVIKDMAPDMADRLEHVLEDRVEVAV